MRVSTALELIKGITYKPGWEFTGHDHTKRFQDCITVHVEYPAPDSDVKYAPAYDVPVLPKARADFPILLTDVSSPLDFHRKLMHMILDIEAHEAREFFSVNGETYAKPFHPHTWEGMTNWAKSTDDTAVLSDVMFGTV